MNKKIFKNFTILFVDDDIDTREAIVGILSIYFKKVYIASQGQEGLEYYKEYNPDIVLSDIQMPILNGIEMCKEIKNINPKQEIVLFTAFNEPEYLKQAVNFGISKYILKPLDEKQFFEALESIAKSLQDKIDKKNLEKIIEVQSKTAAVGEMIGNIAHQWRQPLNIISITTANMISIINSEIDDNNIDSEKDISKKQLIKFSEIVNKQIEYLSHTIDDFRDFLRSDSNNKKTIDLKHEVEKSLSLVKFIMEKNFITIKLDLEKCEIIGNKNQFTQIIINILNNAKDAIVLNNSKDRYIFVKLYCDNKKIILNIKDSGGGIIDEMKDKLFEPYTTSKHKSVGTGIGLYMSYKLLTQAYNAIIEANNVEYEYEGKTLKGAEFKITLPLDIA